jgi:hypothetical protein
VRRSALGLMDTAIPPAERTKLQAGGGGWHRDHEHHACQRDRADARDWHPSGRRRATLDVLTQFMVEAVVLSGARWLPRHHDWRRHRIGHADRGWLGDRVALERHHPGVRRLGRDRRLLWHLPRAQGFPSGSHRGAALRVTAQTDRRVEPCVPLQFLQIASAFAVHAFGRMATRPSLRTGTDPTRRIVRRRGAKRFRYTRVAGR